MDGRRAEIRPVRVSDVLTITQMAYANMTGVDRSFTRFISNPLGRWIGYITFPFYFLFAGQGYKAVADGHTVGCAYLHLRPASGYIFNVSVNQSYRRQGIGKQIMSYLEQLTLSERRQWTALQVDEGNEPARRLYERIGYRAYHPHYLRRVGPLPIPTTIRAGIGLEPLARSEGRWLYSRYLDLEQEAGDRWALTVLGDYGPESLFGGGFWRCLLHDDEAGCAWLTASDDGATLRLVMAPHYWGHHSLGGLVQELVAQMNDSAERVEVYLGSSAHHEAAAPLLYPLGFETHMQPRILMLKKLV